jgi:hypothetical protein
VVAPPAPVTVIEVTGTVPAVTVITLVCR